MALSVTIAPVAIQQVLNNAGQPNAGGSILTSVGGAPYPTYQDQGVTLTDGTPLESVPSAPGAMQYQPPQPGVLPAGTYTFNAAQQATDLLISYSYGAAPFDLQEACARLVAEMYRKRSWIGQTSQIQPGVGTTAYSKMEVEIGTAATIERYKARFLA